MTVKPRSITPYLWYKDQAEEAAKLYVSLFEGSRMGEVSRVQGTDEEGTERKAVVVNFTLAGQDFVALNGGPHFALNEAFSVMVVVDTQQEVDELWAKLTANGGEESQCGWLKDRFGLSWQITPKVLLDSVSDKDPVKSKRAMDAMLRMKKIDIATIERAYAGR